MIQLQVPSFSTFVAGYLRWAVDLPGAWWRLLVLLVDHKGTTEREQSQIPFFLCFRLQTLRRFDTGSRRDFYREYTSLNDKCGIYVLYSAGLW